MSNKYIDALCKCPVHGSVNRETCCPPHGSMSVDSPQEMLSKMGKIVGGGVALIAAFGGGIYLIGKLGDKHNIDDKLNAYGEGLANDIQSFQQGLDKRMSGEM